MEEESCQILRGGWTSTCWSAEGILFPFYHPMDKPMEAFPICHLGTHPLGVTGSPEAQNMAIAFTDGSSDSSLDRGGACVFLTYADGKPESHKISVGKIASNYTCELVAIKEALNLYHYNDIQNSNGLLLFSDSRSALQAILRGNSQLTQDIILLLRKITTAQRTYCIMNMQRLLKHVVDSLENILDIHERSIPRNLTSPRQNQSSLLNLEKNMSHMNRCHHRSCKTVHSTILPLSDFKNEATSDILNPVSYIMSEFVVDVLQMDFEKYSKFRTRGRNPVGQHPTTTRQDDEALSKAESVSDIRDFLKYNRKKSRLPTFRKSDPSSSRQDDKIKEKPHGHKSCIIRGQHASHKQDNEE
ncbi:unnamed protein product [Larinioides sclopetarius]|uniref:RNase H type-1 domain-containing protein n=1 Tax=Larinioides sclopetarius TaxID=280406 RepID=A0AAV1Z2H0_9ARAC